jgi:enamine deaminase RidA (YjgF/YER057c/UK114 family)
VSAGDTVYISGIAPLKGDTVEQLEVAGPGSMPQQVNCVVGVRDRSLTALEPDRTNLVSWSVFTTTCRMGTDK